MRFALAASTAVLAAALGCSGATAGPSSDDFTETPATFAAPTPDFDYDRRDIMIPMRDGVKLHTVILVPKGAKGAGILLTRTPYNATSMTSYAKSGRLALILDGYDNAPDIVTGGGYIRVVQDIRGKYGSEGGYVMNRPLAGTPLNPTQVDHATDTYDTIDWLVTHVPESNGRVGMIGISYDGFLALMALVNPHPALKVVVPMNPMVDGWRDDWFHNGAFREQNLPYMLEQVATRDNSAKWQSNDRDDYDLYLSAGSAGILAQKEGMDQTGFWRLVAAHPADDSFWQDQAVDRVLARHILSVPTLLVHSFWDQEDSHGALAVWAALKDKDTAGHLHLVLGPWYHGQEISDGSRLGAIKWGQDTALWFRKTVLAPFLAQYLVTGAPKADLARVTAFESGTNEWQRLADWPPGCGRDFAAKPVRLYLKSKGGLGLTPDTGPPTTADYVSDPAKPVPFRLRPILPIGYEGELTWPRWLVDDQREASGRTDVLAFTTDVLTAPMTIHGQTMVNLTAATTGTDADWVVKLIDVYPGQVAGDHTMGGYQFPVAMDIFRGRYRSSFKDAQPIEANTPLLYRFALPAANHVFLPGHRIMVQVQSSWFPLYDRNPQTFVPNIMFAPPEAYVKATQHISVAGSEESFLDMPAGTP